MFRLAHLSDPHLGPLPPARFSDLASKRMLGFLNWHLHRSRELMQGDSVASVIADIHAAHVDHVAITGDLVNIGLEPEISNALEWLRSVGRPEDVSVVPGNHDAYVPAALERAITSWAPYLAGDEPAADASSLFPYVRIRGPVAIIGVSSAIATGPLMATGRVDQAQADRLVQALRRTGDAGLCRVVLIHHLAIDGATKWKSRLLEPEVFRRAIADAGAELILHGHTHRMSTYWLPGRTRRVPVIGVQSASLKPSQEKRGAGWNLFEIEGSRDAWRITHVDRGTAIGATMVAEQSRYLLTT